MIKINIQKLGLVIKLFFPLFLVITFFFIFNKFYIIKYNESQFKSFGYTPIFFSIAETTKFQGKYSNTLEGTTNFNYNGAFKEIVVDESQREPLLPIMLILFENKYNFYKIKIILLNLFLLVSGFFLFRRNYLFLGIPFMIAPFFPTLIFYSQIFYPYQFGILLSTIGLIFLSSSSFQIRLFSFLFFSLASLERNIHFQILLVSLLMFSFFEIMTKGIRQCIRWFIYFIFAICLISPFLIRNYKLGFLGMSKISGYALGYTYAQLCIKDNILADQLLVSTVNQFGSDAGSLMFLAQKYSEELNYVKADKLLESIILDCLKEKPQLIYENFEDNVLNFTNGLFGYFSVNSDLKSTYTNSIQTRKKFFLEFSLLFVLLFRFFQYLFRTSNFVTLLYVLGNLIVIVPIMLLIKFDGRYRGIIDVFVFFGACLLFGDLLIVLRFYINKLGFFK